MVMKLQKLTDEIIDSNYLIEEKVDGTRIIYKYGNLISERGNIVNHKFPHIIKMLDGFKGILDGEIAVPDGNVIDVNKKENWNKAKFYVFDIIEYMGISLKNFKLERRKKILKVLGLKDTNIISKPKVFESFEAGKEWVIKNQKEGLVIKYKPSKYFDVRSYCWLKWKYQKEIEVIVIGHEQGSSHGTFLIEYDGIKGRLGALSEKYVNEYRKLLKTGRTIIAEVIYLNKTENGHLFQPILKRLKI